MKKRSKKKSRIKTAAILTIKYPGKMSAQGRRDIAAWLRRHAADLLKHGQDYTTGLFRGRYNYT
jgi:hypothetical protein